MNKCLGVKPISARILAEDYQQEAHKYLVVVVVVVVVGWGGGLSGLSRLKNANPPLGLCQLTIKGDVWRGLEEKMGTAMPTAGTDLVFTQWMWADYKAG